ncbi:heavy metal translocating P-type ATPase, partial [bacterium]
MDCAAKFEKDVAAIPGVARASLNFGAAKLTVEGRFDPAEISRAGARHDITTRPEGQQAEETRTFGQKYRNIIVSGLAGFAALTGWLLELAGAPAALTVGFYLTAMLVGGFSTARKAFYSLQQLNFDMNVLMTAAVTGAALIGEWSEGAVVAFLYSVSNTLEAYTMEKARQSIRELMDIAPREALVRRNGTETLMPVDEVRVGD